MITGKLVEKESRSRIEYAYILLKDSASGKMVTGVISDSTGSFRFDKVANGSYYLESTFIGYEKNKSNYFRIGRKNPVFDAGTLEMAISSTTFDEVTIRGEKNMLITKIDRKVFNLTKDVMAQTGTVSDALQNIPSVSVDMDGNISLRGSENVTILINGRPSVMGTAANLEQMPASMVERIEVITNPSAKYKPDGTGGIINIILKKEKRGGYNGSLSANAGNHDRYNTTLQGNLNSGKFNLSGSYGFRQDYRYRTGTTNSLTTDTASGLVTRLEQSSEGVARPLSHLGRLGLDWSPDSKNMAGVSSTINYREVKRNDVTNYLYKDDSLRPTEDFSRSMDGKETETSIGVTGYFEHVFDPKTESKFRGDVEYQYDVEDENDNYTNDYRYPAFPLEMDRVHRKNKTEEVVVSGTWNRPLWKGTELETGYEGNFDVINQDQQVMQYEPDSGIWIQDITQNNTFHATQAIHALYATVSWSAGKFSMLGGIRAEQAALNLDFISLDGHAKNDYFALYPTIHMGFTSGKNEWQINYSRRVNRPDMEDMNPVPEYRDPRNIFVGNPDLKPEDIHSVEAGYSYKNDKVTLVPTLFYRLKVNGFTMVTHTENDTVLVTSFANLSSDQSAGLDLSGIWKPARFLNLNISASGFYNTIDASAVGYSADKSTFSWNAKVNATVNFTKSTIFQINGSYRSEMLTAQGTRSPSWVVNLGLRQELWKKKVAFLFTVSDLFNTQRMKNKVDTPELVIENNRRRDGRVFYGGFVLNFGSNGKKAKETRFEYDNGGPSD